jgi:hypothetical protein
MLKRQRTTSCPLCGTRLGATVDDQWVPMTLDEYREHASMQWVPDPTAKAAPESCVACGSSRQELAPAPRIASDVRGARVATGFQRADVSRCD